MAIGLNISEDSHGDVVILRLEGRLDAASSPHLEDAINTLLNSQKKKILIDFAKVEYLSSAGMRLLLSATKKVKSIDGVLHFCFINDEVMEIIKMAGFEKILSIFPTEREALSHF